MSDLIAFGGDSGSNLTLTVRFAQGAYGWVLLFPAALKNDSTVINCTGVTDSVGGTWSDAEVTKIGGISQTDYRPATLTASTSFVRTAGSALRRGDTIHVTWDGNSDQNIAVAAQVGGVERVVVDTQYAPYTNGRTSYLPTSTSGIGVGGIRWDRPQGAFNPPITYPQPSQDAEVLAYGFSWEGFARWTASLSVVDQYVANYSTTTQHGTLGFALTQGHVTTFEDVIPDMNCQTFGSVYPQIIVGNFQCYEPSLFHAQAPGAAGGGAPPLFVGHVKHKKR